MDEFPGLLARDFGFRPQGKSAPMSASKVAAADDVGGLELGSGRSSATAPSWNRADSLLGGGSSGNLNPPGYDDVLGDPLSYSKPSSSSSPPFDSIFGDSAPKHSSMPVFDKPVYDDDIFDGGLTGMKNSSSGKHDNVFATMSSASNHTSPPPYDDFLENLGKTMPEPKGSADKRSGELKEQDLSGFDELIPGFGGSSPTQQREPLVTKQQSAASSAKPTAEDPFVVLETTSSSAYPSSGLFTDPLEYVTTSVTSGSPMNDASPVSGGLFDDDELTKAVPLFTSKANENPKEKTPVKTENDPSQRYSMEAFENAMPRMHHTKSSSSLKTVGTSGVQNSDTSSTYERNAMSPKSYEHLETADDVWLTVDEMPLFTQPTSAPPPSRLPPPVAIKQAPFGNADQFSSVNLNSKRKDNDPFSQSSQHMKNSVNKSGISSVDEFEDFVLGKSQRYSNEHAEVPICEEEFETNSAAAAMKEAMDRAEAKFRHAREVRERERDVKSARNRESTQQEIDEKAIPDAQDLEEDEEKQDRIYHEREQREREEKRHEKEQELERERERERERGRGRQAVERATREARERAAAEARLKAERAAVGKVNAEARQRAERAAVQRAANEARERAAAEARERAAAEARERAAAEARERAAADARERERAAGRERAAAEKAAVERASYEARVRAQRAAVERVAAEARERAVAEVQRKAAAAAATARERQQRTENDLESFFNMDARPSSAPKQRNPSSEASFDTQFHSKGFSDGTQRASPSSSSTIRKTQSTTNIVDDLASIFGGPSSGEFQELEGESEERRRARLERHQRTLERAAKALAVKNERDMQAQRDQAERHRIAETLDIEIKRWAAGKEGNLRALLSTLQYVLWPECGWQPVSLTDLITGASVKKVYRKATLCIHPDKVQQKGATLQQKYIAEKVFDILKEAWSKLNSEELF